MWYENKTKRFYAIFHAHGYVGMMTSTDGINWETADDFVITEKSIPVKDAGYFIKPDRMERPFVFVENGKPSVLSLAIKKGDNSYIIFLPLKDK